MNYKTTTNLKEFDLTGMTLEAVKELFGLFDIPYVEVFATISEGVLWSSLGIVCVQNNLVTGYLRNPL